MLSLLESGNAVVLALTAVALIPNALALALPVRSNASLMVGFAATILTFAVAAFIGSFLYLVPAVVIAVLAAREWGYRWCLVSLPAVAVAYFSFDIVWPVRWPFLLLTLCAYALPVWVHLRRRHRPRRPI